MDTGSSTCFLGDVAAVGFGRASGPRGEVMTAAHFRANMPEAWRQEYEELLAAAQRYAEQRSRDIKAVIWRGLEAERATVGVRSRPHPGRAGNARPRAGGGSWRDRGGRGPPAPPPA